MANYLKKLLGDTYSDEMSIEDIGKALEKANLIPKSKLDKARSEVADLKKAQRQALSEDEALKLEMQERIEQLEASNAELQKSNDLTRFTNKFLEQGYEQELAVKAATAKLEGDFDLELKCQKDFLVSQEKKMKDELLGQTTPPGVNQGEVDPVLATAKQVEDFLAKGDQFSAMVAMEQLNNN